MGGDVFAVFEERFADHDGVLEIVSFPGHKGDQQIPAECQFTVVGGGTVRDDFALFHFVAFFDDGTLVQRVTFVQIRELSQFVGVVVNGNFACRDFCHRSGILGFFDHVGVLAHVLFHSRANEGLFRIHERHPLTHHVGSHQGAICVVVFEKRYETCRDTHGLV